MRLDLSRLRPSEWITAGSALALLVCLLAIKWYRYAGGVSLNGWHGLTHVRWLAVVAIVASLALAWLQATRRSPALPVTVSMIVTSLGGLLLLVLIYRVLINAPASREGGSFIGLAAAAGIFFGGYASMRTEGISSKDEPAEIETVRLRGDS